MHVPRTGNLIHSIYPTGVYPSIEPAVSVRNLTKRSADGKVANDSIDLDIERGTLFAILGPNGAGKTTLVSQITMELLPTSGKISVLGYDALKEPNKIVEHVGVVPRRLNPMKTSRFSSTSTISHV